MVALLGPRQVGKTTLAQDVARRLGGPVSFFDLERPSDLARLDEAELVLSPLRGLVVLDEIQRRPELFPLLRVLADRRPRPARFLVLGSASANLLRQESESLAGRIAFHELLGFDASEIPPNRHDRLWLRGGFPMAYTARSDAESFAWREDFVSTFLERDLGGLGIAVPPPTLRRFWAMLAHLHGSVANWSDLGRSMGLADMTVRRYADHLESALVVEQLPPWHENISKRQVKAPKIFVRDSGLLHALWGVSTRAQLDVHPKMGASWEGFVIAQIRRHLRAQPSRCFFWATHQGAELDLLVLDGTKKLGFEVKRTSSPKMTASMHAAMTSLSLHRLDVVHAGEHTFALGPKVRAVAAHRLLSDL